MACHRGRLLRLCLFASLLSISVGLFLLSLLQREHDELDRSARDDLAPAHPPDRPIVNGQREILEHQPSRDYSLRSDALPGSKQLSTPEGSDPRRDNQLTTTHSEGSPDQRQDCVGPWPGYPDCADKMEWMANHWRTDECYTRSGVDGSKCSFQRYLSEIEHWCPLLRNKTKLQALKQTATICYNPDPLLQKLSRNAKFDWLRRRISTHWPQWVKAGKNLEAQKPFKHTEKSILIHIGALSDKAGFKFAENADHGGPLGELVQWSDLIASLYLLGHKLEFSTEVDQMKGHLEVPQGMGGCPTSSETRYQAIYIDIVGLKQFRRAVGSRLQHYKCLFRVLDSFGTEPQFNFKAWKPVPTGRKTEYGQTWGNWDLNPRQFMTMYPHTPDNSFLGFVVGSHQAGEGMTAKRNQSLVYGKELYMWKDKRKYLDIISRYLDVHATIGTTKPKKEQLDMSIVPGFVYNHGILNSTQLQQLLKETKLFVGMGFPYEGPAPLEAIAQGCFFLNPRLDPPRNRDNTVFFKGKPTRRALTSQNPYTETFIGKPYVYTVDIGNSAELTAALREITTKPTPPPYLPYEFTNEGLLERVAIYLEHQQFCVPHQWPPASELQTRISKLGESCKEACYREGLVCEPELFPLLNSEEALKSHGLDCAKTHTEHSVHGPSIDINSGTCSIQENALLLSCVGESKDVQRLCSCRSYKKGQVGLCLSCTR